MHELKLEIKTVIKLIYFIANIKKGQWEEGRHHLIGKMLSILKKDF
jgi:hypothetical protein